MPSFVVSLERKNDKRGNPEIIEKQVDAISRRAVAGARRSWSVADTEIDIPKKMRDGQWVYTARLVIERRARGKPTSAQLNDQMTDIVEVMKKTGTRWRWEVVKATPTDWSLEVPAAPTDGSPTKPDGKDFNVNDIVDFDRVLTFEEIDIPEVLMYGSDSEIESHPAFVGIYGRAAQIRLMAGAMRTMIATKGKKRNHATLHGKPGCAKSKIFEAWQTVIGKGGYMGINANSATKAGLESIFLERLYELGAVPPFFFIEEIEKTKEEILTFWLSILDERAQVQKTIHRVFRQMKAEILCFATANDKLLFDKMMGGRPGHPGAISSRMRGIYVPRPNWNEMKRILLRDIELYYPDGKEKWADACIDIAQQVGTNDPRIILSYLDGRDRLLSGEYEQDIISVHEREKHDDDEDSVVENEEVEEAAA